MNINNSNYSPQLKEKPHLTHLQDCGEWFYQQYSNHASDMTASSITIFSTGTF